MMVAMVFFASLSRKHDEKNYEQFLEAAATNCGIYTPGASNREKILTNSRGHEGPTTHRPVGLAASLQITTCSIHRLQSMMLQLDYKKPTKMGK